ncbi:MAG TPA: hypothetical protein PLP19_13130 [bacterium]|nr:hypothetical protein [bacterium]HPN44429.1 hypothetical protein [bacterium]
MKRAIIVAVLCTLVYCSAPKQEAVKMTFQNDIDFLQKYTPIEILKDSSSQAQIIVCPALQGRVMTSTATGSTGDSYGWINYDFFKAGQNNPHFNPYGGEERIWLGPEGGQFSIYFKQGDPFDLEHWFTPPAFNEEPFDIIERTESYISFGKNIHLVNYSGAEFDLLVSRRVRLLTPQTAGDLFGVNMPTNLKIVAHQSENTITNIGVNEWKKETGLLSIWILGMFNPSPSATIVLPFKKGPVEELGPIVNDVYFGQVPAERLKIADSLIYFSADGKYRSKIGIPPRRCLPYAGSYDADNQVLTLVTFSFNEQEQDYVNSLWQIQEQPFAGDVVNSYNDGPSAPGAKPMGPFYELESSSAAAMLKPGESKTHVHTTIHIQGNEAELDVIAQHVLGATIADIKNAFK